MVLISSKLGDRVQNKEIAEMFRPLTTFTLSSKQRVLSGVEWDIQTHAFDLNRIIVTLAPYGLFINLIDRSYIKLSLQIQTPQ